MSKLYELDEKYVANTYGRFPIHVVKAKGSTITDYNGKKYIDLGTGIGVTAFGHGDKRWLTNVKFQISRYQHTSNLYYTSPCVLLAKMLAEKTGLKKVFFGNSGAEANECAIKVARKYKEDQGEKGAKIITLKNSFHGRTITTLSATGQDKFHESFLPLTDGFIHVNANDIEEVKNVFEKEKISGVLIECVQGEGGVNVLDKDYVTALYNLCKEKDVLFMVDEVQTGNGRTGTLYAYMNYGVLPDVVTTAKGLGGGLPIGACILGEKVENVLTKGSHGSTFGGNPICAAGALSIISRLDDKFLEQVKIKSQYIFDKLKDVDGIESVSGLGLMIGIKTKKPCKEVLDYCMENGVLVLTAKDKIRLLPPLNISKKELEKAISVIIDACK